MYVGDDSFEIADYQFDYFPTSETPARTTEYLYGAGLVRAEFAWVSELPLRKTVSYVDDAYIAGLDTFDASKRRSETFHAGDYKGEEVRHYLLDYGNDAVTVERTSYYVYGAPRGLATEIVDDPNLADSPLMEVFRNLAGKDKPATSDADPSPTPNN